jgi:chromosome segregation ATPase
MAETPNLAVLMEAASNIEWLEPRIRGLLALSAELRKVGGMAGAIRETEQRLTEARAEEEHFAAERRQNKERADGELLTILNETQAEAARRLKNADDAANEKIAKAISDAASKLSDADIEIAELRAEPDRVLAEAKKEAERILAEAKSAADALAAKGDAVNGTIVECNEAIVRLKQDIMEHEARRDGIRTEAAAAEQRLSKANAALARIKASLPE